MRATQLRRCTTKTTASTLASTSFTHTTLTMVVVSASGADEAISGYADRVCDKSRKQGAARLERPSPRSRDRGDAPLFGSIEQSSRGPGCLTPRDREPQKSSGPTRNCFPHRSLAEPRGHHRQRQDGVSPRLARDRCQPWKSSHHGSMRCRSRAPSLLTRLLQNRHGASHGPLRRPMRQSRRCSSREGAEAVRTPTAERGWPSSL